MTQLFLIFTCTLEEKINAIVLAEFAGDTLELSVFKISSGNWSVREIMIDHLAKLMRVNIKVVKWKGY